MKIGIFTDLRFTSLKNPTGVTKHIYNIEDNIIIHKSIFGDNEGKDDDVPYQYILFQLYCRTLC